MEAAEKFRDRRTALSACRENPIRWPAQGAVGLEADPGRAPALPRRIGLPGSRIRKADINADS